MEDVNVTLPATWHDLSQEQLRQTFNVIAKGYTASQVRMRLTLKWAGLTVIGCHDEDSWLVQAKKQTVILQSWQLTELAARLSFLDTPPQDSPAILQQVGSHLAIDTLLSGVPFETYIILENFFQGYLQTKDDTLLCEMGHYLYPGSTVYTPAETIGIFYWFVSLKAFLSCKFRHFFAPADGHAAASVEDAMNAQIRALTQGDVTKEAAVFATDTWRALTELDAIARETAEIKNKYHTT